MQLYNSMLFSYPDYDSPFSCPAVARVNYIFLLHFSTFRIGNKTGTNPKSYKCPFKSSLILSTPICLFFTESYFCSTTTQVMHSLSIKKLYSNSWKTGKASEESLKTRVRDLLQGHQISPAITTANKTHFVTLIIESICLFKWFWTEE